MTAPHQNTSRIPVNYSNFDEFVRRVAAVVNQLVDGHTDNHGSVTLTVDSLTTTLTDRRIGVDSVVHLTASNDIAGGEMGVYVDGYGKQTCTINHGSDSRTRTFDYTVWG